jgi:hypothetical protein
LIEKLKENKWGEVSFPLANGKTIKKRFEKLSFVVHRQRDNKDKYFVMHLIQPSWKKEKELRIGYYILGKMPKMAKKWVWGQYCPFIPVKDLKALLKKAKSKGLV